jgi:hypothetical protein
MERHTPFELQMVVIIREPDVLMGPGKLGPELPDEIREEVTLVFVGQEIAAPEVERLPFRVTGVERVPAVGAREPNDSEIVEARVLLKDTEDVEQRGRDDAEAARSAGEQHTGCVPTRQSEATAEV